MELWKAVPKTNGLYEISDTARIRRVDKGNFLNPHLHNTGYMRVCLCINGKTISAYVHILMAETFLGERPNRHDVNHKNGIKTDNHLSNLEYIDRKHHEYHTRHILKHSRNPIGEEHGNALLSEESVREIHSLYCTGKYTMNEIAQRYNVHITTISSFLNGYSWKHLNLPKPPQRDYHLKGIDNPKGKVTPDMERQIQVSYDNGHAVQELTKQFNLGRTTIYRILRRSR